MTRRWQVIILFAACAAHGFAGATGARGQSVELIVRVEPGSESAATLSAATGGAVTRESLSKWNARSVSAVGKGVTALSEVLSGSRTEGAPTNEGAPVDIAAYVVEVAADVSVDSLMSAWEARDGVRYVQRNHRYAIDTTPDIRDVVFDPQSDSLLHHDVVYVPDAWRVTMGSPGVRVGFVDTGVQFDHPDLVGSFWINAGEDINGDGLYSAEDENGIDDDGNGLVDDIRGFDFVDRPETVDIGDYRVRDADPSDDGSGHGTAIAGVIGAREGNGVGIAGIAPRTSLVPLRAFGADGRGDDDDIAAAILYAAEMGVDVLNLSFGDSYYSPLLHEAIRYAANRGTIVVASAGNVGGDDPHYPSDYPEVISTVWLTADGSGPAARATYGTGVDIGAPGSGIYTTLQPGTSFSSGDTQYGRLSGSSLSAPIVSGVVALVRSIDRDISGPAARNAVLGSAVDIGTQGWDHRTGAGLVNAGSAVSRVVPSRITLDTPTQDGAIGGQPVAITGSAAHPSFASYSIDYAAGYENLTESDFSPVVSDRVVQVLRDTLAVWDPVALADGPYTLRLRVALRSGQSVDERRRVYIDNTPPDISVDVAAPALHDGHAGYFVEVSTDDLTEVSMSLTNVAPPTDTTAQRQTAGDRLARRHGVTVTTAWDPSGPVRLHLVARNRAGLESDTTFQVDLPREGSLTAPLVAELMPIRAGFALPFFVDFDNDGLAELLYNQYDDGELGDTVKVVEYPDWSVTGELISNVFPRDVGDTNGDGLLELLGQVSAATIILEQDSPMGLPRNAVFVDTTGLSNPTSDLAVWGARLADTDGDGVDEILTHNTRVVRVLERSGSVSTLKATLINPTTVSGTELAENGIAQPELLVDDLDQNGHVDILFGDTDGDLVLYESVGADQYELRWQLETDRYSAGRHFASGRVSPGGPMWFATATINWLGQRTDREYEPDATIVTAFVATGPGEYEPRFVLAFPGEIDAHSTLASIDIENDGDEELVVVSAPDLYILDVASGGELIYHADAEPAIAAAGGVRSARVVVGDVDGDGDDDLVAGLYSDVFVLLRQESSAFVAPPTLVDAYAGNASSVFLSWRAPSVDSVRVLSRISPGPFDIDTTIVSTAGPTSSVTTLILPRFVEREYALQAWRGGLSSALSRRATIRPHAPARLESIAFVAQDQLQLTFNGALSGDNPNTRFSLVSDNQMLTAAFHGSSVVVGIPPGRRDSIAWSGLRDTEGTPIADSTLAMPPGVTADGQLYVASWTLRPPREVDVVFSRPVTLASVTAPSNYSVRPGGVVESVEPLDDTGQAFRVAISGIAVGPTGLESYLSIDGVAAVDGASIDPDGKVIALSEAASGLADAYVFPNPVDPNHDHLFVGGLPNEAEVHVFGSNGARVVTIREVDNDGGIEWDLRDEAGALVPSGIYLLHVRFADEPPVLLKAAIIR